MHPLIEILFSITLSISGIFLIRKMGALKKNKRSSQLRSSAEKQRKLLRHKISARLMAILFTLILTISIGILIENGLISITW